MEYCSACRNTSEIAETQSSAHFPLCPLSPSGAPSEAPSDAPSDNLPHPFLWQSIPIGPQELVSGLGHDPQRLADSLNVLVHPLDGLFAEFIDDDVDRLILSNRRKASLVPLGICGLFPGACSIKSIEAAICSGSPGVGGDDFLVDLPELSCIFDLAMRTAFVVCKGAVVVGVRILQIVHKVGEHIEGPIHRGR